MGKLEFYVGQKSIISPYKLSESPNMALDPLFKLISLSAEVYYNGAMCGSWELAEPSSSQLGFHWVTHDHVEFSYGAESEVQVLGAGDLLILNRPQKHRLRSRSSAPQSLWGRSYSEIKGEHWSAMLCGRVKFTLNAAKPFLESLPEYWIVKAPQPWLSPLLELLRSESARIGSSQILVNKIAEILFASAVRNYVEEVRWESAQFLNLFVHAEFGNLMVAIAEDPSADWNLDLMAQFCAMSRSAFAQHFKEVSGWTPHQFLTWWRMHWAAQQLRGSMPLALVAEKSGYQSLTAFIRAFGKEFGQSPAAYRRSI